MTANGFSLKADAASPIRKKINEKELFL